ncbi:MAG: S1 family peptidase [Deltaproteobacteria bacterium]
MKSVSLLIRGVVLLSAAAWISCAPSVYRDVYPTLLDGKYDTEFPYRGCAQQLEEIGETIQMLNCVAYYKSYVFAESSRVRSADLSDATIESYATKVIYYQSTGSGTATVVHYQDKRVALLTCAHILDFPDTTVSYHPTPDGKPGIHVQTFAIKERQSNYIAMFPEGGELSILAMDRALDVALVGRKFDVEPERKIPVFSYPLGKARELEWGSFVYLFGYPMGFKMVTKGTVSSPNKDKQGSFLTDAVFNKGFSGGLVLGIRDGVPNFELVGIVRLVPGMSEYLLVPNREADELEYDPRVPYSGDIFVDRRFTIRYGITQSIGIEAIVKFVSDNRAQLERQGYTITMFRSDQQP